MSNPYLSPSSLSAGDRVSLFRRTNRLRFLYVVGVMLSLCFIVALIVSHMRDFSQANHMKFFGVSVAGPFLALALFYWGPSQLAYPILAIACFVCLMTSAYLIKPNNVSLVISLAGALLWTLVPLLVLLLPDFGIRV